MFLESIDITYLTVVCQYMENMSKTDGIRPGADFTFGYNMNLLVRLLVNVAMVHWTIDSTVVSFSSREKILKSTLWVMVVKSRADDMTLQLESDVAHQGYYYIKIKICG